MPIVVALFAVLFAYGLKSILSRRSYIFPVSELKTGISAVWIADVFAVFASSIGYEFIEK